MSLHIDYTMIDYVKIAVPGSFYTRVEEGAYFYNILSKEMLPLFYRNNIHWLTTLMQITAVLSAIPIRWQELRPVL